MSGKTTPARGGSASGKRAAGGPSKSTPKATAGHHDTARGAKVPTAKSTTAGKKPGGKASRPPAKRGTDKPASATAEAGPRRRSGSAPQPVPLLEEGSADQLLSRAEADITAAIDALNNQMNAALEKLTELVSAESGRGHAVVRTAPLDRATATFQRLVSEVVEDQQAEMLPPLIALRNELAQRASLDGDPPQAEGGGDDFHQRGVEMLDHVLQLAGVQTFQPRIGERFDPLIHLAVGETWREDLEPGVVAETFQPGFRSTRGKVLAAARILVNRR